MGEGNYGRDRQLWVRDMYRLTKKLDPTRLVEDNSSNVSHVESDINSWHMYMNEYNRAKDMISNIVSEAYPGSKAGYVGEFRQSDTPLINSEYGGIGAGMGDQDISWSFKYLTNELRKHDKVCGYVYTELSDIEWEHNGFLNYDRTEKSFGYNFWFPGFSLSDLNNEDFFIIDNDPCPVLKSGEKLSVPVLISHWSDVEASELTLNWHLNYVNKEGKIIYNAKGGSRKTNWKQFTVLPAGSIEIEMPECGPVVGALCVQLSDQTGRKLAANYINVHVDSQTPRRFQLSEKKVTLRFAPNEFSVWNWGEKQHLISNHPTRQKAYSQGFGAVEYEIEIPDELPVDLLNSIEFSAELSSKAGDERLSWPARKNPLDYPQTDNIKFPTTVDIFINGIKARELILPDDPADARGVLSHLYQFQPGSYGWMVSAQITKDNQQEIFESIKENAKIVIRLEVPKEANLRGGLAIFGEKLGRYPTDPAVKLTFSHELNLPDSFQSNKPVTVNKLPYDWKALIPTGRQKSTAWRYTEDNPGENWITKDFDDSAWKKGSSGFGTRRVKGLSTRWDSSDIWLRKTFQLTDLESIGWASLQYFHDENMQIYLNGELLLNERGATPYSKEFPLQEEQIKLLRKENNVIAVHCQNKEGGQYIDVGLSILKKVEGQR